MLNPVFSTAHMRHVAPICNEVCGRLQTALVQRVGVEPIILDMLEWMGRTSLELIGQAGLGHSFDPLVADSSDEFATLMKTQRYAH